VFEPGKIEGTIVIFNRYDDFDMQIPAIITIEWYKEKSLSKNLEIMISSYFKNELLRENQTSYGKSLNIFNQEVAGTEVKLNIDGELTVRGDVNFQDREIMSMNQTESSSWDLDIEQTQKFGIDGTIGDRIFVEIDQDSEATFSWDNDLSLEYKGKENDILKSAQGGNISPSFLPLPTLTN
jgi:cell surface protein SprA